MTNLSEKLGDMTFDGLITDVVPAVIVAGGVIKHGVAEASYKRGTVMEKGADGKLSALGTNPGGAATEDFNGDGTATTFTLAADPLPLKVLGAKVGTTDATVSAYNAQTGVVTLSAAPAAGTKNVHITYEVAGANVPDCILCDDVTVGTDADVKVAVYKGGCFDPGKVTVKSGYTITAADKDKLRTYGIIFKAPMAQI